MSLHEEQNEDNEQVGRAHFEQERLDLSASVEAALLDGGVLSRQWLDDLDEQSASQPVISSYDEEIAEQTNPSSQHSGMLARLAQRFTSSFAAIKLQMPQQQAEFPLSEQPFHQDSEEYHLPRSTNKHLYASTTQDDVPLVRVIDTVIPPVPVEESRRNDSQKHHALKRNAKVRLETAEQPAITRAALSPQRKEQETGETLRTEEVRDALNRQQRIPMQREQGSAMPYGELPVTAPISSSGSGTFKSEQSDVMITNARITASSVVLVTLTTNPGPVVVQYVSLQPEVGFTVHLTAPVTMPTNFNYVILTG